jgi:NAD(P)-dependent dehydrogenase (short-subunit alcohol dehydrogenase family)
MPRIFVTGSTDGLGRAAAGVLIGEGHDVVLHARTRERAAALSDLAPAPRESSSATSAALPRPEHSPIR